MIRGMQNIGHSRVYAEVDHDPSQVATDVPMGAWIHQIIYDQNDIEVGFRIWAKLDHGETTNVLLAIVQNSYSQAVDPGVNDDATKGFSIGSEWLNNTTAVFYKCSDPTPGSAVWQALNS